MARKKLNHTNLYPYHIYARTNNKEPFPMDMSEVWEIFQKKLSIYSEKYQLDVHAFVLMSNHYHLIATTSGIYELGEIMREFHKATSQNINLRTNRINHVFGGPYKASLITQDSYYYNVLKYVYANPIKAKLVEKVENYNFSTLSNSNQIKTSRPKNGIDCDIPYDNLYSWVNSDFENELFLGIKKGLKKTVFKPIKKRHY